MAWILTSSIMNCSINSFPRIRKRPKICLTTQSKECLLIRKHLTDIKNLYIGLMRLGFRKTSCLRKSRLTCANMPCPGRRKCAGGWKGCLSPEYLRSWRSRRGAFSTQTRRTAVAAKPEKIRIQAIQIFPTMRVRKLREISSAISAFHLKGKKR